jgi:hypothetical protein
VNGAWCQAVNRERPAISNGFVVVVSGSES